MFNKRRICLFFLFLTLPVFVFAFRIDNPRVAVKLAPGQSHSGTVNVENTTADELYFKVYLQDFIYTPPFEGDKEFSAPGTTEFSLAEHINFSPREFSLGPYESRRVNFTLTAPDNFPQMLCGVLFFETSIGKGFDETGKGLNIMGRVGSLFFVEPDTARKNGRLDNITAASGSINGTLTNDGKGFLHCQGTYYVMSMEGMIKERGPLPEFFLLPRDARDLSLFLPEDLDAGEYTLVVTVDLEENAVLVKEVDFKLASGAINITNVRD